MGPGIAPPTIRPVIGIATGIEATGKVLKVLHEDQDRHEICQVLAEMFQGI